VYQLGMVTHEANLKARNIKYWVNINLIH